MGTVCHWKYIGQN